MVFKKGDVIVGNPEGKRGETDKPMNPADQKIVNDFYDRNAGRMDPDNPNLKENRERIEQERGWRGDKKE
jgi:hypothetical protein